MTTKDEALRMALEFLEQGDFVYPTGLATAIKEALANVPASDTSQERVDETAKNRHEQEPMGQLCEEAYGRGQVMWFNKPSDGVMLYTFTSQPVVNKSLTTEQEAVAWMIWTHGPVRVFMNKDEADTEFNRLNHAYPEPARMLVPLYTTPPSNSMNSIKSSNTLDAQRTWVELTNEEIKTIYANCNAWDKFEYERILEAKLKEKNT